MSPDEPNIMMDDWKEAEKWEHLEVLCHWPHVRHHQQRPGPSLLCKDSYTLVTLNFSLGQYAYRLVLYCRT
jgi:hypothetical protein